MKAGSPVRVIFVCWGNICRSPMAERIAQGWVQREGINGVEFTSAATSSEELGAPIDPRAVQVLADAGYRTSGHRAHQITADEIRHADLVIAMERMHLNRLQRLVPKADNLSLLTDYDPGAIRGSGVPDPWYGGGEGFLDTMAALIGAMPGIMARVRELQRRANETEPARGR